jgi:predicted amino acid racemase
LTREPIPGLYADAFALWAEVIELKTKPSKPYGELAQDAFGHTPVFQNNGHRHRAILAVGRQDVDVSAILPRADVDVVGATSDHLILDVRNTDLAVGAHMQFDLQYSALLTAMTSPYVEKDCRWRSVADARWRRQTSHPQIWARREREYPLPSGRVQEPTGLAPVVKRHPPC